MATLPLQGIKVVDLTQMLAGPYATQLLADMGADVIKVEPPGGDQFRTRPPDSKGTGALWLATNRNKRSIVVNLKDPPGQAVVRKLASDADVFIQNLKPGDAEKFGLGYEQLAELNPRLVYCTVTGYGTTGPLAGRPAFEFALQAFSGLMSVTGEPDGPPLRVGASVTDITTAMYAAMAISFALIGRSQTGKGQHVDVSLYESVMSLLNLQVAAHVTTGEIPHRWGSGHPADVPYQVFRAKDGDFVVAAGGSTQFRKLCRVMGLEHLTNDPRYAELSGRVQNREALVAELSAVFATRTTAEWLALLEAEGVICSMINTVPEALQHPQSAALELVGDVPHPAGGTFRMLRAPMRFDGQKPDRAEAPPAIGQHTDEVLRAAGYGPTDVAKLREDGAIQ